MMKKAGKRIIACRRVAVMLLLCALIPCGGAQGEIKGGNAMNRILLENERLLVEIDLSRGAALCALTDKDGGHPYIRQAYPLFSSRVTGALRVGGYTQLYDVDSRDMRVTGAQATGNTAHITLAHAGVEYALSLALPPGETALRMAVTVVNNLEEDILARLVLPCVGFVSLPGDVADACAMIPGEIGSLGAYSAKTRYGHGPSEASGMPLAFNTLETAAIFDRASGRGLAFMSVGGQAGGRAAPIQLHVSGHAIYGYWAGQVARGDILTTPALSLALLRQGWREAVDLYVRVNDIDRDVSRDIPAWLLHAGAVYSTRREGTGGAYQCLPGTTDLSTQISSFRQMPELLDKARALGTDVLLLIDFYEPADLSGESIPDNLLRFARMPYWNKGDYIPRGDLGGEEAFCEGVRAVREAGGRVIVYVEPFIVFMYSRLARERGAEWAARKPNGQLDDAYVMNFTMQPATPEWQDRLVAICESLVGAYGVDGILLDSMGWQWNRLYYTDAEKTVYSMDEYNRGLMDINTRVREAIRRIKPDAVVISESGGGLMAGANDGGFTADYCWNNGTLNEHITLSPTRYAYPALNLYSSGLTLNTLNQVFAAGYSLSLCDYWLEDAAYIKQLVTLRRQYADALVHGQVIYPALQKKNVGAYCYRGDVNELLVIVNAGNASSNQRMTLPSGYALSRWAFLLGGQGAVAADDAGELSVRVPARGLAVLRRIEE